MDLILELEDHIILLRKPTSQDPIIQQLITDKEEVDSTLVKTVRLVEEMDLTLELTPEECSPPWLEWSVKENVERTLGPIITSVTFLEETPTTSTVVQTM